MTRTYVVSTNIVDILGVIQSFEEELYRVCTECHRQYTRNRTWTCRIIAQLINAIEQGSVEAYMPIVNQVKAIGLTSHHVDYLLGYATIELQEAINAVLSDVQLGTTKHVEYNLHSVYDLFVTISEPYPHENNHFIND